MANLIMGGMSAPRQGPRCARISLRTWVTGWTVVAGSCVGVVGWDDMFFFILFFLPGNFFKIPLVGLHRLHLHTRSMGNTRPQVAGPIDLFNTHLNSCWH